MALMFSAVTHLRSQAQSSPGLTPYLVLPNPEADMDTNALWDLAEESAKKVSVIAAALAAKESQNLSRHSWKTMPLIKTLGELAGYLFRVVFVQDKSEDQQRNSARVCQFLEGLEKLCTFMCPPQAMDNLNLSQGNHCHFPILNALKSGIPGNDTALVKLIENSLKAFVWTDLMPKTRSRNYATQPKSHVKKYFAYLEIFSTTKDQPESETQAVQATIAGRSAKDIETPGDVPAHVHQTLYNFLVKKYSKCCCAPSETQPSLSHRHRARLRLKEIAQITEDNAVFDTVFSRASRKDSAHSVEWQHVQFQIPRRRSGIPQVGFAVDSTTAQEATKHASEIRPATAIKSASQFCELLQKRVGPAKICLQAKGSKLFQIRDLAEVDDDIANEESVSLADVLQRHELVARKRLLLAYVLAQSFWQYYNSDWMSVRWTAGVVRFFLERRGEDDDDDDACVLDGSPYIALPLADGAFSLLSAEHLPTESVVHRYPRLLAFGVLLLQLGRRKRRSCPESQGSEVEQKYETVEERISTDLNDIRRALKQNKWPRLDVQEEARQTLREVLSNCSNPRFFEAEQTSDTGAQSGELTIEERRAIIYRRIVYPLKVLMEKLGWVDILGNVKCHEDGLPEDRDVGVTENTATFLDSGSASASSQTSNQRKAHQWLHRIQDSDVTKILFAGFQANRLIKRIRIAVLDTGYDPTTPFFSDRSRKRRIQRWKDMAAGDSESAVDEDGHGTHVLSILMKVIPVADFYVARVAPRRGDLVNSTENVAKAIKWAAEEQEADIISMSFGFDHEIPVGGKRVISNAISDALRTRDQQILFFAAAANEGVNQPEMFPANHPHVISIRGTDDKGWLQRFNPPKGYAGLNCFMTLGQDVPGAGLSRDGGNEVYKSGTSVSTPIAAGIAAILLSYARLCADDLKEFLGEIDRSRGPALLTVSGMRKMFTKMSTEMLDGWYYLAADQFLKLPTHQARLGWIAL